MDARDGEYEPFDQWNELVTSVISSGHTLTTGADPTAEDYEELEALTLSFVFNNDYERSVRVVIPAPLVPGIMESAAKVMQKMMPAISRTNLDLSDENIEDFIESNDRNEPFPREYPTKEELNGEEES